MRWLLAIIIAGSACGQSDPVSRSWNQPVEPFRIIGNIYYVGASDITSYQRDGGKSYDVVFVCSASVPEGYNVVTNPKYPNAAADYRRTFATLKALPCDVFLGAHGNFFDLSEKRAAPPGTNPFIDPAGYKAYVESAEARFLEVVAKQSRPQRTE